MKEWEQGINIRVWQNDTSGKVLHLVPYKDRGRKLYLLRFGGIEVRLIEDGFETQEEAIDYAVDWMRNHKNPS